MNTTKTTEAAAPKPLTIAGINPVTTDAERVQWVDENWGCSNLTHEERITYAMTIQAHPGMSAEDVLDTYPDLGFIEVQTALEAWADALLKEEV